jgi:DNA-binding CsgD family transcriptional regulator
VSSTEFDGRCENAPVPHPQAPTPSRGHRLRELGVTRREAEVLELLVDRPLNSEVAARLYVSERTVESHVSSLMRKLGAANRRELAERARALLSSDAPTAPELPAALELAVESVRFAGRAVERDRLRELWRNSQAPRSLAVVVTGEAGIGKSRLVAELAYEVHQDGATVLHGVCRQEGPLPFEPIIEAIAADVARRSSGETERLLTGLAELAQVLQGGLAAAAGASRLGDAVGERQALLDEFRRYLHRAAGHRPVLFIIDDIHWATEATRRAVRHLLRGPLRSPTLVVLTCRDTAPDWDEPTRALVGELLREPHVDHLALEGLDDRAVAELAAALTIGDDRRWEPVAIQRQTDGNPLLIRELVAAGGRRGTLDALLRHRGERLSDGDNAVLDVAAVIGTEFDPSLVAAVSGVESAEVYDVLQRAEHAGLVSSMAGTPTGWAFVHGLFRGVRYDAIGSTSRMHLHFQIANALVGRSHRSDSETFQLAAHAYASFPIGNPGLAVEACRAAGDLAAQVAAVEESVHHYQNALEAASAVEPSDSAGRLELEIRLGSTLHNAGRSEGTAMLEAAAATARNRRDGRALGEIAWALSFYGSGMPGLASAPLVRLVDDALDLLPAGATSDRARLLGLRASHHGFTGDIERATALSEEAVALARRTKDPVTLGQVLMTRRLAIATPANIEERMATAREMLAIGDGHRLRALSLYGRFGLASSHREMGNLTESFRMLDEVDPLLGDTPPVWAALLEVAMNANRLYLLGELAAAERAADRILAIHTVSGGATSAWVDPTTWHHPHLLAIRHYQGRIGELAGEIRHYAALGAAAVAVETCALAHAGDLDEVRRRLDVVDEALDRLPFDLLWLTALARLAEAAELIGHRPAANAVSARLRPYADRLDNIGDGSFTLILLALTQAAVTLGAGDAALLSRSAVAKCRRMQTPLLLARALVYQAALEESEDLRAAALREGLELATERGAGLVQMDARRLGLA